MKINSLVNKKDGRIALVWQEGTSVGQIDLSPEDAREMRRALGRGLKAVAS